MTVKGFNFFNYTVVCQWSTRSTIREGEFFPASLVRVDERRGRTFPR